MTGKKAVQPFIDKERDVAILFNGEIYNYLDFGEFDSDGHCLMPLYREFGAEFLPLLDGEFALAVVDFARDRLIVSTDIFSTKPLWLAVQDGEFALGSYASSLLDQGFTDLTQVPANTTLIFSLRSLVQLEERRIWTFTLNQHKSDFSDWNKAFEDAVRKRTRNTKHGVFIGLSSGYDSGALACELSRQGVRFSAYSILGAENPDTVKERLALLQEGELIALDREAFQAARSYLKINCEEYALNIDNGEQERLDTLAESHRSVCALLQELEALESNQSRPALQDRIKTVRGRRLRLERQMRRLREVIDFRKTRQLLTDDNGAIGMSHICGIARARGELVYLSGSGADEVFSDYGYRGIKHYGHSTIGGHFMQDLAKCFPWKNFFGNTQRAYLMKEEYVTGSCGVEGRYPYLDREVVQEFLWLQPALKNKHYKAPLHHYMRAHNYPFDESKKVGFNCGFSGMRDGYESRESVRSAVGQPHNDHLVVDFSRWEADSPKF